MATIAQILLKMARLLRPVYYGTTTGAGTTTTTADTARTESADYFNGGVIFFLSGALVDKTAIVTDFISGTITHAAQSQAPGSGIDYAVIDKKYPRGLMVDAINSALAELGPLVATNQALVTIADTESYTLPAGVSNVLRVEVATDDAAPYNWEAPYRYWKEKDGSLYFADNRLPATAAMPIRLHYLCAHDRVSADSDTTNPDVDADLLATLAALHAARNKAMLAGSSDPEPGTRVQVLSQVYAMLRAQRPVRKMNKDSRLPAWITEGEDW